MPVAKTESLLYSKLFTAFVDVFCFIYYSAYDLENIVNHLVSWVEIRKTSAARYVPPEIVIIIAKEGVRQTQLSKSFLARFEHSCAESLTDFFSGLRFTTIPRYELLSPEGRIRLSDHLHNAAASVRRRKTDRNLLFSADHFVAFYEIAFDHLPLTDPFNFVKAARLQNPISRDLIEHLTNFIKQIPTSQDLIGFAAETIASSFILDHYSPDMHAFNPNDVFNTLYRDPCNNIARKAFQMDRVDGILLPSSFVNSILKYMQSLYKKYTSGVSAAAIHLEILQKHATKWRDLKSQTTCFVCLRRTPQHNGSCEHCICEECIGNFATASPDDPLAFTSEYCFLCQAESHFMMRAHPPTAGIGVLSIDGGGVRVIVATTMLELLEERINLPIPIQEHFKLILGISAGGLIVPAMYFKGWTPAQCTSALEKLADVAFRDGPLSNIPLVSAAGKILMVLFNDAIYRAKHLERLLKETYGSGTKMMDFSYATSIGAMVGLPVATTSDPSTLIFTNYNGVGERAARHGYRVHQGHDDVNVWEVTRSSTAAPIFFKSQHIKGIGTLQDAGVLQNNPLDLALSEFQALYPSTHAPQYVLNLGNGSGSHEDKTSGSFGKFFEFLFGDTSVIRLKNALESLTKGTKTWETFRRLVRKSSTMDDRTFRLDISFDGPEPKLDDTKAMPQLKEMVRADISVSQAMDEISRRIIASLFYFELESLPEQWNDQYTGVGNILCLRRKGDPALSCLTDRLWKSSARFIVNGVEVAGDITDPSFWDKDGNFSKKIHFDATSNITILLKEKGYREYPISGGPFLVQRLIAAQSLNAPFGTACHRKRKRPGLCDSSGGTKRRRLLRKFKC